MEEESDCGSWEGTEGIPFICTSEEPTGRRDGKADVLGTGELRTLFLVSNESPWRMEHGLVWLLLISSFFFFCLFFPDASTMEAMTSPNKKSDNKLH